MAEVKLTSDNFEAEVLNYQDGPVLVDFFATWCGPCKVQGPIVEELAEEMKDTAVKVASLDVDKAQEIAQKYGVLSIPTLIVFRGGEVKETLVGLNQKEALEEKLQAHQ